MFDCVPKCIGTLGIENGSSDQIQMTTNQVTGKKLINHHTFNFERLDILWYSIRHPSKKLLSFELAQSIDIQLRASRYITGLNQTSE